MLEEVTAEIAAWLKFETAAYRGSTPGQRREALKRAVADITWSLVKTITAAYQGCRMRGVTCMGGHRMLAVYEKVNNFPSPNPQRLFRSADDGATWSEIGPYLAPQDITERSETVALFSW